MMENDSVNATPHGGANGQRMQTSLGRTSGPTRRSTKGQWTAKEDNLLCEAVQRFNGKNWKKIAECFKDRTDVQCLHRWQKVLNPELVKGPWTKEEDEAMIELVKKYGAKKWSTIAQHLPGRIGKQCRERWHNHLNPNINKEAWTQEEELTLIHAHQMYGNKWAELTKFLPGRSDNSIKNHWNSSVRKKIDSYFSSGLLAQFQGLPRICEANQSLPSPCSTVPQSSEDESVIREEAEREEISECSQSSSVLGVRSVDNILVREDFQLSKAPTYGEKPAYFEEHTVFSVPEVPYEMGGSSKYGNTIISMDLGEDFLMNCDFNVPENNEYVPFPLESPADITAVSSMAKPDHIISEDDCYRVIFPDTDMDGYCVSANINEGSNINDSSGPFPARTHFFTHESTLLCSSEFNPFNDISHQNGDLELEKGPDDFKSNAYYKVDENELNAENDSSKLVPVDISNLESSSNNQSFAMHHDPVHSNNLVKTIPNDVSIDTCPPEVQSLDKNDNGSLFYEPPRFPSLDIPFFSCDLIQAGDHTQQEYSPLGIRQLMMSSVNCFSPIRLWDSPKERDSNNADAVLKSAAKTFTITPSILKKRNRGCVSPLSEKRNKNKLETGMDRVLLSNLARDFSRQDVMFSQNGNVAHDKENMNCVPNSMTHPQTENEKNIGDEVKPGNSAVNTKSKGDLDTMAKAVPQPLGVLVEHDTNDLLFFSPEKPENRSDRISYGNNCTEKFNSSSRDPYIGDAVSLSPLGLKTDDKRQLKPAMSAQSSMALDPPRLMARSKDVAENLSMFGETPLKRSYDSPSAWKSPWFMNSFLPGPRVDTDITIEDIGYFLSPGDRSVDAIGLMKQLSMQSANALADAQEVLGDETPETYLKCRRSIDRKRIQDNTSTFHSSTQSLLEPNALTEKRILDFSDCGTPGKSKENSKVLTSIGTCSPSSYLLKGAVK